MEPALSHPRMTDHLTIGLITSLSLAIFVIDLFLPLAVADAVLYGGVVLLAAGISNRPALPVWTAAGCSLLAILGAGFGPVFPGVPLWFGVSNRVISLAAIWAPVVFASQRRRTEVLLREANESLERRVQERTAELATSEKALTRSQKALHALTGRIITAQEEERRRISRDLHDDINQRLAMLTLGLQGVERQADLLPNEARSTLSGVLTDLITLSDDVRHLAYRFHPSILDDLGLETALQRMVDEFASRTKIKVLFVHQPLPVTLSKDIATALTALYKNACLTLRATRRPSGWNWS